MRSFPVLGLSVLLAIAVPSAATASDLLLSRMVKEIQVALRDSQRDIAQSRLPAVSEVELVLKTVQKDSGGGKISLVVVEVGGDYSTEFSTTVALKLIPPAATDSSDVAAVGNIREALKSAIVAAAAAIDVAQRGNPPLTPKQLEVSFEFAVTSDGHGGFAIAFPPFEASIAGKVSRSNVQSIKVVFQ